jgi:hypothetical protein
MGTKERKERAMTTSSAQATTKTAQSAMAAALRAQTQARQALEALREEGRGSWSKAFLSGALWMSFGFAAMSFLMCVTVGFSQEQSDSLRAWADHYAGLSVSATAIKALSLAAGATLLALFAGHAVWQASKIREEKLQTARASRSPVVWGDALFRDKEKELIEAHERATEAVAIAQAIAEGAAASEPSAAQTTQNGPRRI